MPGEPSDWRRSAKTVAVTFLVTSAAWLIGGAILFERLRRDAATPDLVTSDATNHGPMQAFSVTGSGDATRLVVPVEGVRRDQLVDTFTQSREGGARAHNAIDILAPRGTPVIAAAAGQVEKLFVSVRGGNTVYVRSPDRSLIYYYAHLDAYAPGLAEKQAVRQGQRLGTVGYSGDANIAAPHLHFEIQRVDPRAGWWQGKVPVNPYPLLKRGIGP
jgi:peptidoglycan LD-endopeptidase LytH